VAKGANVDRDSKGWRVVCDVRNYRSDYYPAGGVGSVGHTRALKQLDHHKRTANTRRKPRKVWGRPRQPFDPDNGMVICATEAGPISDHDR
jgi:hypothetical protein